MLLNYVIAIVPTIIIIIFILKFDRYQKEPVSLLAKLFVVGMISVIPVAILESLVTRITGEAKSVEGIILYAFFGVALIEEGVKFFGAKLFAYKSKSYDELYDGIIYCVMVSLGFATIENILYVIQYGTQTALLRAITAVPAHAVFGVLMGYFLSLGKFMDRSRGYYRFCSIAAPVIAHGIYDAILFLQFDWMLFIFVPFVIFLYIKAIRLIKSTYDIPPIDDDKV